MGIAERIIIFGTHDGLKWLQDSPLWFGDATFKVAPEVFLQVYTIHTVTQSSTFPCLYALLQSKDKDMYDHI